MNPQAKEHGRMQQTMHVLLNNSECTHELQRHIGSSSHSKTSATKARKSGNKPALAANAFKVVFGKRPNARRAAAFTNGSRLDSSSSKPRTTTEPSAMELWPPKRCICAAGDNHSTPVASQSSRSTMKANCTEFKCAKVKTWTSLAPLRKDCHITGHTNQPIIADHRQRHHQAPSQVRPVLSLNTNPFKSRSKHPSQLKENLSMRSAENK